jgi:hypothetical protein
VSDGEQAQLIQVELHAEGKRTRQTSDRHNRWHAGEYARATHECGSLRELLQQLERSRRPKRKRGRGLKLGRWLGLRHMAAG